MEFEIVTAVTPDQMDRLKLSLPTWILKPQFKGKRLHILYSGFKNIDELSWIEEYFPDCQAVEFNMDNVTDQRELMLSSFVYGSAQVVKTDHFVKLDNDCYFLNDKDVFEEDDFEYSMCAHSWGYTKPAWWFEKMEAWSNNRPFTEPQDKDDKKVSKEKVKHSRIISFCCLHNTEFVRQCAQVAGDRLPIPSHDSFLWYMADRFPEFSWKSKNLKKRHGVDHISKYKGLRESICSRDLAWDTLPLNNIQLEITSKCNMACPNCDRCCGTARTNDQMSLRQVMKFVQETRETGREWGRIDIIGGEPTLHKELNEIIEAIGRPCKIRLTTNGTNPEIIKALPNYVKIRDSEKKENNVQKFEVFNFAPADFGFEPVQMCSIPWRCGLALSKTGYYLCGAGASIARVFGLDIAIKELKDVTVENLKKQREVLCRLCGHSRSIPKDNREATTQQTSPMWEEAFKKYNAGETIDLPTY